jgi:hypothetical protein
MGVALGLLRPFLYGSSGFADGLATRRLPLATVNMIGGTTPGTWSTTPCVVMVLLYSTPLMLE